MDPRDRLKDVHQTDLTESRVNEEFVDWLKTKGPTYLLIILIGVCAYLGIYRWKQSRLQKFNNAWAELAACSLPESYKDVAQRYSDVRGLPQQALRSAADQLLGAVQNGRPLSAAPDAATAQAAPLTADERDSYLTRARDLYLAVLDTDDGSIGMTLHAVSAMQGLAAVAESRGEIAEGRDWYQRAAQRAETFYADLASRIRARAESAGEYAEPVELPAQAALPDPPDAPQREPATIDDALRDLVLPDEAGAG